MYVKLNKNKIVEYMEKENLSYRAMADKTHLDVSTISRILNNRDPSAKVIAHFLYYLPYKFYDIFYIK